MKNFFFVISLFFYFNSNSQNYEIIYDEFISITSLNLENQKKNYTKDDLNATFYAEMKLNYANGISCYSNFKSEKSITEDVNFESTDEIIQPYYYKDHKLKKAVEFYENYAPVLYGKDITVVDTLANFDWQITNSKEVISGYNCVLAKCTRSNGRKILAWFTDEIAINEGPRDFCGLPGLILQIQINDKVLIVAKTIKKIDSKSSSIKLPANDNEMTPKEFKKFEKEVYKPRTINMPDGSQLIIE